MAQKTTMRIRKCPICGEPNTIGHVLLAHGSLTTGATPRRRRRVRSVLPELYRRLETAGFDEVEAGRIDHIVTKLLKEKGLT